MSGHPTAAQKLNYRRIFWFSALLFLCNPHMNLVDVLPDLVGYLLLRAILRRVSEIDDSLAEARKLLKRLCWLQVARGVALYWAYGLNNHERPTMLLTLTLVFGILDLLQIYPLCTQLFQGLSYLGMRNGATLLLQSGRERKYEALAASTERLRRKGTSGERRYLALQKKADRLKQKSGRSLIDVAQLRCCAFATVKVALAVLPECAALTQYSYGFNFMPYITGFRILAMLVCLLIGVIWLVQMTRFCSYITRDTAFWENVLGACEQDKMAHPERVPYRAMRHSLFLMCLGGVFAVNFSVDGIGLLPTFLLGILWLIALCEIRRSLPKNLFRRSLWASILQIVASVACYTVTVLFYQKYDIAMYAKSEELQAAWRVVTGFAIAEAVALILLMIAMSVVWCMMRGGYCYPSATGCHSATDWTKKPVLLCAERSLIFPQVCALLCFVSHVIYAIFLPTVEWIWLMDVGVSVMFVVVLGRSMFDLREELDPSRMLCQNEGVLLH